MDLRGSLVVDDQGTRMSCRRDEADMGVRHGGVSSPLGNRVPAQMVHVHEEGMVVAAEDTVAVVGRGAEQEPLMVV